MSHPNDFADGKALEVAHLLSITGSATVTDLTPEPKP